MMRCLFPFRWSHNLAWPIRNVQTCTDCGRRFDSLLRLGKPDGFVIRSSEFEMLDCSTEVVWPFEGTDGI